MSTQDSGSWWSWRTTAGVVVLLALGAGVVVSTLRSDPAAPRPAAAATPTTALAGGGGSAPTTTVPASGASTADPAAPPPTAAPLVFDEVVLVGDSLSQGTAGHLRAMAAEAGVQLRQDAAQGRSVQAARSRLRAMQPSPGALVVIALGTNDRFLTSWPATIDGVMEQAEGRPVLWVNVAAARSEGVNTALAEAPARWPNLRIADWASEAAGHPEWFVPDRIHLDEEGYEARARFVLDQVLAWGTQSPTPAAPPAYVPPDPSATSGRGSSGGGSSGGGSSGQGGGSSGQGTGATTAAPTTASDTTPPGEDPAEPAPTDPPDDGTTPPTDPPATDPAVAPTEAPPSSAGG